MSTITQISSCTTTACAFNNEGCTAFAINVGGSENPSCATFTTIDLRAGLAEAEGQVGACQRLDCAHNDDLMCTAASITVGGDAALCETYQAR
ncbi:MAG: DUF1540 domain-containing protein [Corynebacterium sp.]|uniref:DUF1540 domain-containing protein n=1 Tax=Corynebacterium sp. TaxID=1720 RepID=UPI0026DFE9AB|nr:DUF1540 domain-containing protein [Corynebacterium sp.]MDO5670237.1 DUF1540 domain-containing protein [Corynebacterium sp.]